MKEIYIIAEIGQNHNGSKDIAKLIIDMATMPIKEEYFNIDLKGINAIKLTKRDLEEEMSETMKNMIYDNPNSFGRTYGEHRNYLELTELEHYEIFKYTKEKKLDFIETLCSKGCLNLLKYFIPDKIKVASRDLTNLPLIEAIAETNIPIIISTGMAGKKELDTALNVIEKYHNKISILYCVSEYPTKPENVNLHSIKYLKNSYSKYKIGYSDHTIGISTPLAAVALGAEIIEKHVTLYRDMKGTDHKVSLGPEGLRRMIRDIRLLEISLGEENLFIKETIKDTKIKLERSIASKRHIKRGEIITEEDIHLLSPGDGVRWADREIIIGKKALIDIPKNEIIYIRMIE